MEQALPDAAKFTTAFALAGLGGFNAHGAGFLAAASDCGVVPNLVTATSGQIVVLANWLQGDNLEKLLIDPELEHNALAQLAVRPLIKARTTTCCRLTQPPSLLFRRRPSRWFQRFDGVLGAARRNDD